MEIFIFVCLSAFIIYSLVQIAILLQRFLVNEAQPVCGLVIVALSNDVNDVEFVARKYMLKYCLDKNTQVVFVDVGLNDESKSICEKFCKTHSGVTFCPDRSLYNKVKSTLNI